MTLRLIANDGEGGGGGGPHPTINVVWFDVNWSWTEGVISGAAQGFDLVLYTGSDPNAEAAWLGSQIIRVPITSTRCVVSFTLAVGTSPGAVKAAVRTRYPGEVSAWALAAVAATPAPKNVLPAASDNLIPNYNSELGTQFTGVASALVVQDAANAVAGDYCRKLDASATNLTDLTGFIPCMPGDLFYLEAMAKVSSGSAAVKLRIAYFDKTFASVGTPADSVAISGTSYPSAPVGVTGTIPATAVYAKAQVFASTTAASQFGYFDQLLLRRADGQTVSVSGIQTFTGNGTFTVPAGVRRVRVTVTGGGGGGGGGTTNSGGGGGGGAGQTSVDIFDVSPGDTFGVVVGIAGAAGAVNGNGGDGGDTTITHNPTGRTISGGFGAGGKLGSTRTGGNGGGGALVRGRSLGSSGAGTTGGGAGVNGTDGGELNIYRFSWTSTGGSGAGGGILASSTGKIGGGSWGPTSYVAGGVNSVTLGSGGSGAGSYWGRGGTGGTGTPTPTAGSAPTATFYGAGGGGGGCAAGSAQAGGAGIQGVAIFEWGPMI